MASPSPPRVSWALLVMVVAALAVGAAASILVSASSAPAAPSSSSAPVYLPTWLVTVASIGLFVFVFASLVLLRTSGGPSLSLNRAAVTLLAAVLVGLVFVLIVHFLGFSGLAPPPTNNSTSGHGHNGSTTPPPTSGGGNVTGSSGIVSWPGLPPWLPFVILAAVVLIVVVVAVPGLGRMVADRRREAATRAVPAEARGVREALTQASTGLSLGEDPRVVILALYSTLLMRLHTMVLGLEASTPEEIRARHLERLGVRAGPARTLTRLFEEARYSSHPMDAETSRRAQEAVQAVLDDLNREEPPS